MLFTFNLNLVRDWSWHKLRGRVSQDLAALYLKDDWNLVVLVRGWRIRSVFLVLYLWICSEEWKSSNRNICWSQATDALGTDLKGDSCCCTIYQNNRIKLRFNFKEAIQCKSLFLFVAHVLPIILTSASKPTSTLGYCELREPVRARENGYRLLWSITANKIYLAHVFDWLLFLQTIFNIVFIHSNLLRSQFKTNNYLSYSKKKLRCRTKKSLLHPCYTKLDF